MHNGDRTHTKTQQVHGTLFVFIGIDIGNKEAAAESCGRKQRGSLGGMMW